MPFMEITAVGNVSVSLGSEEKMLIWKSENFLIGVKLLVMTTSKPKNKK